MLLNPNLIKMLTFSSSLNLTLKFLNLIPKISLICWLSTKGTSPKFTQSSLKLRLWNKIWSKVRVKNRIYIQILYNLSRRCHYKNHHASKMNHQARLRSKKVHQKRSESRWFDSKRYGNKRNGRENNKNKSIKNWSEQNSNNWGIKLRHSNIW